MKINAIKRRIVLRLSLMLFALPATFVGAPALAYDTDGCSAANVSEFGEYTLIYHLSPADDDDTAGSKPSYTVDDSGISVAFDRTAYCMELEINGALEWTWVSMDAITTNVRDTGVPVSEAFQQKVNNMNVFASAGSGVTTGMGITTGNVEFFNNNYSETQELGDIGGSSATYDFDDTRGTAQARGSMQIHNYGQSETIFAYNGWDTSNSQPDDLGIGTNPGGSPDWTNEANSALYSCGATCRKDIYVLVRKQDIYGFAGNGSSGFSGNNGPAIDAELQNPRGAAIDAAGRVYIADSTNHRIRRVETDGDITTFAGVGSAGFSGDGGDADQAEFDTPVSLDFDAAGNLYIADFGNKRIRRIDAVTDVITTVAGNFDPGTGIGSTYNGDNIPATTASLRNPQSVSVTDSGVIFIVDQASPTLANNGPRVRRVDPTTGTITTVAGNGTPGNSGNDGLAIAASLDAPFGIYADNNENLYIADSGNHAIRRVDNATGLIAVFAGNSNGAPGNVDSDGEPARDAGLRSPRGVTGDANGNIYVADYNNDQVHKIEIDNRISTIAGDGARGFNGDGRDPLRAMLAGPFDVVVDGNGDPIIVDFLNDRLRRVGLASLNRAVTDVFLSNDTISELNANAGATVGMLTSEDESVGNTHLYSLAAGAGDTDNGLFQTSGSGSNAELQVGSGGPLAVGTYAIRIQSDDQQDSIYQQTFVINVVSANAVPPVLTLVGADPQIIVVGDAYVELGATASDDLDGDITGSIVIDASAVDTAVIGDYTVTYNVMDSSNNAATELTRTVSVVSADSEAPVITLTGANPQVIIVGAAYAELGATATDNVDGDISGSIVIDASAVDTAVVGNYSVTYDVMDAAGNAAAQMTRMVSVVAPDTEAPVISLTGANPQVITTGTAYSELGATATDNVDGDVTGSIVIDSSAVNTAVAGSYSVTYNVMDAAGNAAVETVRTVTVQNAPPPPPPPPPPTTSGGGGSLGVLGMLFLLGAVVRRRIFVR